MSRKFNIAIAGATGNVGREIIQILEDKEFPVDQLYLLASSRSKGQAIEFRGEELIVEDLAEFDFSKVQIGLFSPGGKVSAEFAPKAAKAGCLVIDNTSHFRMHDNVPLIVPEVNASALEDFFNNDDRSNIIANPNCSTIQMVVALKPLHDQAIINRVVVSTYQSVSGAGKEAMDELFNQTQHIYTNKNIEKNNKVSFCVDVGVNAPDIYGIMSKGIANVIVEMPKTKTIAKKILLKYFKTLENKSAKQLLDDTDCIIEIIPEKFSIWSY